MTDNKCSPDTSEYWLCPSGCQTFSSSKYSDDFPPECGSCGLNMTTDTTSFDELHQYIENFNIAHSMSK